MAQHRPLNRLSSSSPNYPSGNRKYTLRRPSSGRRRAFPELRSKNLISHALSASTISSSTETLRPVLVPLHPNLRRLPSRIFSTQKGAMRVASQSISVVVGTKRKRIASSNENSHASSRPIRGPGRLKRIRSASRQEYTSDDGEASSMDVDAPSSWAHSGSSDGEEDSC